MELRYLAGFVSAGITLMACQMLVELSAGRAPEGGADAAGDAATPQHHCARVLAEDAATGRVVFCADFDVPAEDFGFKSLAVSRDAALSVDPFASSPPSSLKVHVEPRPTDKPLVFAGYVPPDDVDTLSLSLSFHFSFGAPDAPIAFMTEKGIGVAGFQLPSGAIAVFGVSRGEAMLGYEDNPIDPDPGKVAERGYRIGSSVLPIGHDFVSIELRLRKGLECVLTQYVGPPNPSLADAGPSTLYLNIYVGGLVVGCARLPDEPTGGQTVALVGGFSSRRDYALEWRFDNVVVRSR